MCGLIGLVTTEKNNAWKNKSGFIHQGFEANMWRGRESTGIALVKHGEEKNDPYVYKDAICAFDFCNRPFMKDVIANIDKYTVVLGHCRSATRGYGLTAENAHPFQYNHITLIHNGTVDNAHDLVPYESRPKGVTVDSDLVAYAMGHPKAGKDEIDVLERLRGAFCLVWYNTIDQTFNIARNERKPLHFCYGVKENTLYYTSEYEALVYLTMRRGIDIEGKNGKLLHPKENTWYKFKLNDLRGFESRPFVLVHRSRGSPGLARTGFDTTRTGITEDGGYKEPTAEELEVIRKQMANPEGFILDLTNDKAVKDFLRARRALTSNLKCGGLPSKAENVRLADKELAARFQLHFHQVKILKPLSWHAHKNNQGQFGYMLGVTNDGIPLFMHSVQQEEWLKYQRYGRVYVNCVGVADMDDASKRVVVIEHPSHRKRMDEFFREAERQSKGESAANKENVTQLCRGPDGGFVSEAKFLELTKGSCAHCGGFVNPRLSEQVIWLGDNKNAPICHECTGDPDFWTYMNMSPKDFPQLRLVN